MEKLRRLEAREAQRINEKAMVLQTQLQSRGTYSHDYAQAQFDFTHVPDEELYQS